MRIISEFIQYKFSPTIAPSKKEACWAAIFYWKNSPLTVQMPWWEEDQGTVNPYFPFSCDLMLL